MAKSKTKGKGKVKKKKWVSIFSPKDFPGDQIGETYAAEANETIGRTIGVSMMNLTREPKKQSVYVTFEIDKILDNGVGTKIKKMHIMPTALKRMVRRNKDRVDDSFIARTKDLKRLRVKPIVVTKGPTSKATQTAIRKELKRQILTECIKKNHEDIFKSVMDQSLQKPLATKLRKVFPVHVCEIRMITLLKKEAAELKENEKELVEKAIAIEEEKEAKRKEEAEKRREAKKAEAEAKKAEEAAAEKSEEESEEKEEDAAEEPAEEKKEEAAEEPSDEKKEEAAEEPAEEKKEE